MKLEQRLWSSRQGWTLLGGDRPVEPSLVLFFAAARTLDDGARFAELRGFYPSASLIGCTTGGEIAGADVLDGSIAATAVEFATTRLAFAHENVAQGRSSLDAGASLAASLPKAGLRGVFVLSDGVCVNGSELVQGVQRVLGSDVALTGGLAGDGARFGATRVGLDANPAPGHLAAIGFYGDGIRLGRGSGGGWSTVGPERIVTRAEGNTLFDLDDEPALDLYKHYLGPEAANLPASALLFPLRIHPAGRPEAGLVRTVIGVDEERKAMTFAGSIPTGHVAQVMLGHFDDLIGGAGRAARRAAIPEAKLAILVSCIGRKLLLGQRTADEVDAVADVLDNTCRLTGFYSYGEIAPSEASPCSDLHNQTMTITTIGEA